MTGDISLRQAALAGRDLSLIVFGLHLCALGILVFQSSQRLLWKGILGRQVVAFA